MTELTVMRFEPFSKKKKVAATYSPTFVVPSALRDLTSLFGMGRGVPPRYSHQILRPLGLILAHCPKYIKGE